GGNRGVDAQSGRRTRATWRPCQRRSSRLDRHAVQRSRMAAPWQRPGSDRGAGPADTDEASGATRRTHYRDADAGGARDDIPDWPGHCDRRRPFDAALGGQRRTQMSEDAIHLVTMPKWGLAMQEGTLLDWHVLEGGTVAAGEPLCDIETA